MLGFSVTDGGSSSVRMVASNPADPRKLMASTRMAYGAVMAPTSSPAMPGPPIEPRCATTSSSEFPSTSWSLRTSEGRYVWYETSKKTVQVPTRKPTTYSCQMVSASRRYATGMEARNNPRPRSVTMRMGRRRSRSTQTPAGSANSRKGRNSTVPRSATSNALASSTSTAASGSASAETCEPTWLIVCPDQSFRKSL